MPMFIPTPTFHRVCPLTYTDVCADLLKLMKWVTQSGPTDSPISSLFFRIKVDARPVVHVWKERVIVGVPDSSTHKAVLFQRLRVAECHALSIDIFYYL